MLGQWQYETAEAVGNGSFGCVFKIRRKTEDKFLVAKECSLSEIHEREADFLRDLKHPNIVRYRGRLVDETEGKLFILMEYFQRGDLGTLICNTRSAGLSLAEDKIWNIFTQVVLALHNLHTRPSKILHRDIKPANIFLDELQDVKLGDFGVSKTMGELSEFACTHAGTLAYMSPEQLRGEPYDERSDLWSLGCVLHELCTLCPPFAASNPFALGTKILEGQYCDIPHQYSEQLQFTIRKLLQSDSKKRGTAADLLGLEAVVVQLRLRSTALRHRLLLFREGALAAREKELEKREGGLKEKDAALKAKTSELDRREKTITIREECLIECHKQLERAVCGMERVVECGMVLSEKEMAMKIDTVASKQLLLLMQIMTGE